MAHLLLDVLNLNVQTQLDTLNAVRRDLVSDLQSGNVKLETLTCLKAIICYAKANTQNSECLSEHLHILGREFCLPILEGRAASSSSRDITLNTIHLIVLCFTSFDATLQEKILDTCEKSFEDYTSERAVTVFKDNKATADAVLNAVDLLTRLIGDEILGNDSKNKFFSVTLSVLGSGEDHVVSRIIINLLPLLITNHERDSRILWQLASNIYFSNREHDEAMGEQGNGSGMDRVYLLLCGLADIFLPVVSSSQALFLLHDSSFWCVLQSGFYDASSVTRKRAQYLLKRAIDLVATNDLDINCSNSQDGCPVFWWKVSMKKELLALWDSFVLFSETLEGSQVHVIRPVLESRFEGTLMKATLPDTNGVSLLHFSWISCLIQRMSGHDSTVLRQWAVKCMLLTDVSRYPVFKHSQQNFLCGSFIKMMTETKVYYRNHDGKGIETVPIEEALKQFFMGCCRALSDKDKDVFFADFIMGLCRHNWNGYALVFIAEALGSIPNTPVLKPAIIDSIRELLSYCVNSTIVHVRGAIQCFIFTAVTRLMDTRVIEPRHILPVLAQLKQEESIKRGAGLWSVCMERIQLMSECADSAWAPAALCQYIQQSVTSLLKSDTSSTPEALSCVSHEGTLSIVRLLLLAVDAGILFDKAVTPPDCQAKILEKLLAPAVDLVVSAPNRAYVNKQALSRSVMLLRTLFCEATRLKDGDLSEVELLLRSMLESCVDPVCVFMVQKLADITSLSCVGEAYSYLHLLEGFMNSDYSSVKMLSSPALHNLVAVSGSLLKKPHADTRSHQLQQHIALLYTSTVCHYANRLSVKLPDNMHQNIASVFNSWHFVTQFVKPSDSATTETRDQFDLQWGRISSRHLSAQWNCVEYLLHYDAVPTAGRLAEAADAVSITLDVIIMQHMLCVFKCLNTLMPKLSTSESKLLIQQCWRLLRDNINTAEFWALFNEFLLFGFSVRNLEEPEGSEINALLHEVNEDIVGYSEEKRGLLNTFTRHFIALCTVHSESCFIKLHADNIISALMFGPIYSKGHRFDGEVMRYLVSKGDDLATNQLMDGSSRSAVMVRVEAINFLVTLRPADPAHVALAQHLIGLLMEQQKLLIKNTTYKNFTNSLLHRQKQRVASALLILEPFMDLDLLKKGGLEDFMWHMFRTETQPSVRLLAEWIFVRLHHRFPRLSDEIFSTLKMGTEKKGSFITTLLSVLSHITKLTDNIDHSQASEFFLAALPCVFPWCTAHHFNIRVFAQVAIMIMWRQCKSLGLAPILDRFSLIETFVKHSKENSSAERNANQLMENVMFKFHALKDYSLETIYRTVPYLTDMTREEWIEPEYFIKLVSPDHHISIYNSSPDLSQCSTGGWRVKHSGGSDDAGSTGDHGDVQRKITPWRNMLPESDLDIDTNQSLKRSSDKEGLILVTSLVNKIPNLGGLCRTGEIFGISEFVIGNLDYIKDPMFESLSVTAQKWLNIKEVKAAGLKEYLLSMSQAGYTLVGVEQTANSSCLTKYSFPAKTLLLLGNEKEGIPVDLIQILDVCVEIPQLGVIRSLNVHVSGAILVWEYTRQQLISAMT